MREQQLNWCNPLALAQSLGDGPMALLYSSAATSYSGGKSLLAYHLLETAEFDNFDAIAPLLASGHQWFGYLSYEMRHDAEHYSKAARQGIALPRARLMRFADVYVFDHQAKTLTLHSDNPQPLPALADVVEAAPAPARLYSNMSRQDYEKKAAHIIEAIKSGSLYQANLTRKFHGTWDKAPDSLALFARLCRISPAPYSSYLRMDDACVLSSSPELFLKIGTDGSVSTRPIKGSAPRGATPAEDTRLRDELAASEKNRAENLMITDLMRNDLARACHPKSVEVSGLFDVTTHATIHHMASTVTGQLAKPTPELLRACFPPGSMTGAPKIRAVELCNALEGVERGIYSGAIGWFSGDGSAELSVVIRTLILSGKNFEFQVGGGIVADSTPHGEWQETMDKSMGILKTLGISRQELEAL